MKKTSLLLICLFITCHAYSQTYSTNGGVFTPKGHLHVLHVFVGYNHTTSADNVPGWDHDDIPDAAKGADNVLFNSTVANIGSHDNLSSWFYEMSGGQFIFTWDVFPEQIQVQYSTSLAH